MAEEGIAIKCIRKDGDRELGGSVMFQHMLLDWEVRWRISLPRAAQSNGIAKRAILPLVMIARNQLIIARCGEDFSFLSMTDATFKTAGTPHEKHSITIASAREDKNASCTKTNSNMEKARSST